jgi:NAD(P)-dependent dehydrogenase (short-subunit alcohol dehydrogenase family)
VAIVTARSVTAAEHVVREIEDMGGEATHVRCDVTDEAQVDAMVQAVVARFGSIDFAFNNAGVGPDGVTIPFSPLVELAESDWDTVVDTNLKGVFLCMKHELRQMREQCSGVIVNTSSTGGLKMMPGFGAYGPSKAAVMSLTRLAAAENKDRGIRVNVVAPGPTKGTGMMDRLQSCLKDGEGPPPALMGTPEDVARVVLWLCSDEASFVTGNVISVDGGLDVS